MFLLILVAGIFLPSRNTVLPRTGIEDIKISKDYSGVCLKLDGEYALYKKIGKKVFVRKSMDDSFLIPSDTPFSRKILNFDFTGNGALETVVFKDGVLSIKQKKTKSEKYSSVKSFVFYDVDDNGTPDLLYVDKNNILHVLVNKFRINDYALVYAPDKFIIEYHSKRKKYTPIIYPHIIQGKIPLSKWDKAYLKYHGSTVLLEKGKTLNLYNAENPVRAMSYSNDTLNLEVSFLKKQKYTIEITGKKLKNKIAEGVLPQGVYKFKYFVGPLKPDKYTVVITIGQRTFTREITVK